MTDGTIDEFGGWLSPLFSDPYWLEDLRQRFRSDPAHLVIVDNALEPTRYRMLTQALREDCDWDPKFGVVQRRSGSRAPSTSLTAWVDQAGFAEADPADQGFRHEVFRRARPGREMAPGLVGLIRFKSLLSKPCFLELLGRITGTRPTRLQEFLIRRMGPGDWAKPHDDAIGGRSFCLLLYLSDGWRPEFDSRFIMHMPDGERRIDPLPNRMVLFDVNMGLNHSVRPMSEAAAEWHRYNFSIWFA